MAEPLECTLVWFSFPIGEATAEPLGRTPVWILFPVREAMAEPLGWTPPLDLDLNGAASHQAVHDAQEGDGIDSVRPELGSPLTVLPTLSHVRNDRGAGACGAVYCVGAVAARSALDHTEKFMTRRMATVPIQFEPAPESPLTDSQTLSHVRKDRSVGACGAVYCVGAVAACPAFDQNSHAAHDAQDGKGIDSVRPEPGSPLDCRGQFVPCSQRLRCPCVSSGILRWRCTCAPVPQSPQGKVPLLGVRHAQAGTLVAAFADFFLGLSTCTCPSLYWQTTAGCRSLWDLGLRGSFANMYARVCTGRRGHHVGS